MQPVRKNDIVVLSDDISGRVIDIITSSNIKVLKLQKLTDDHVMYVEAHMVRLEKQCTKNYMLTISHEVVSFFLYTLTCLLRGILG